LAATVVAAGKRLAAAVLERLRAAAHPEDEIALVHAALAEPVLPGDGPRLRLAAQALQRLPGLRSSGRSAELALALEEADAHLGGRQLLAEREQVQVQAAA